MGGQLPVSGFRLSVIGFVLLVLLFGCLQPYSGQNQTVPATQPKVQENKTEVTAPNITQNVTPPAVPPAPNVTKNETNKTQETKPSIPQTNLSIADLLSKELDGLKSPGGGPYSITTYQWKIDYLEGDPQAIAISQPIDIYFNKKVEKRLTGFGFKVYDQTEGGSSFAQGIAITVNESSILESYVSGGSFDTEFNVPGLGKKLYGCTILSKNKLLDNQSRLLVIYKFDAQSAQ